MAKNKKKTDYSGDNVNNDPMLTAVAFSERVSTYEKEANNFKWYGIKGEAYDNYYPDNFGEEYIKNVEDNFALLSGDAMKHYTAYAFNNSVLDERALREEGIDVPKANTQYFDFVTPAVRGIVGDQQQATLNFVVTDSSFYTQNYIKEQLEQTVMGYLTASVVEPMQQQILAQYAAENGITDFFALDAQQRQQMQSDVAQRTQSSLPHEVRKFLKYGGRGKTEQAGQALADALVYALDLKLLLDEALYYSFATGGIVFTHGIRRLKPYAEIVDLTGFYTWGWEGVTLSNNVGYKRVKTMHPSKVWTEYGDRFNQQERNKFSRLIDRGYKADNYRTDRKFLGSIDLEGMRELNSIDLQTQEGQRQYGSFLDRLQGHDYTSLDDVRVAEVVWQSLAPFKLITRSYADGTIRTDWHRHDYYFDPANGDISETTHWVNEYSKDVIIGRGSECIHVDKGPLKNQFRDPTDPYTSRSHISGVMFNSLMGKGKFKAPLDYVKSKIHAVNVAMRTIQDREATDIGRVLLMTVAAKPKNWTWGKFLQVIKYTKMVPIQTQGTGLTPMDVNFFKEINLEHMYDISMRVNYVNFLIQQINEGLSYNQARGGNIAASTSVSNNISNLNRSFAQTSYLTVWYNKVAEEVIENLIYLGKQCVKGGNIFLRRALDDGSIATIDMDVDEADDSLYCVQVMTDRVNTEEVGFAKNIIQPAMQSGGISFLQHAVALTFARTRGDIHGILDDVQMQVEIDQAKQAEFQQVTAQQQAQYEKDLLELKHNYEVVLAEIQSSTKKEVAALQSMTIARGNDVDGNMENDYIQDKENDREVKRDEIALEREALILKDSWEKARIEIEKQKASQGRPRT